MRHNHTHLVILIDDSGSMGGHQSMAARKGFNELLKEQEYAAHGYVTVSAYVFGSYSAKIIDNLELSSVELSQYYPETGGGTAIVPVMKKAIDSDVVPYRAQNYRVSGDTPGTIVFVLLSDGQDGASDTKGRLKELVTTLTDENTHFFHIAIGGHKLPYGFKANHTFICRTTNEAIREVCSQISEQIKAIREREL